MSRIGEPADVALFLCGHDGHYVSGQMIDIDGGISADHPLDG
jgi:NAD(P)-dependent dehydrogenase (short-subunit alcohol dehydrogenase family)